MIMRLRNFVAGIAVGSFMTLVGRPEARASTIIYSFSVIATDGPLNGTTASGTFSFDSSSVVPGGINSATGLLTSLDFTWNGITYNQTTANTGALAFSPSGALIEIVFGSFCFPSICLPKNGQESWGGSLPTIFRYTLAPNFGRTFDGLGSFSLLAVPEPSTLLSLG